MWDTWVFRKCGEFQIFYLQNDPGEIWDSIGRVVLKDLIQWQTLPPIKTQGGAGTWDRGPLDGPPHRVGGRRVSRSEVRE
jgi:hypothetical protein